MEEEEELCGGRLRRANAVQVCMTCLDTDSDMYSMSEYKLEQAYEELTGYPVFPLFDKGNLKHTLCEECAQRLINFNKFRDKSLRARALMMDFVKQHKVVSAAALRPLQAALAPRAGEGEPAVKAEREGEPAVKVEGEGEPAVEGEGEPAVEREGELSADSVLRDAKLLDEARCRVLLTRMSREEERALAIRVAPLPARLATNDEYNIHPEETEQDEIIVKYEQVFDIDDVEADNNDTRDELRVNTLNSCFETTRDALRKSEDATPEQDELLSTKRKLICSSDSNTQNNDTDSEDLDTQSTSQGALLPATNDDYNIHPDTTEQQVETIIKCEEFDFDTDKEDNSSAGNYNNDTRDERCINTQSNIFVEISKTIRSLKSDPENSDTSSNGFDDQTTCHDELSTSETIEAASTHTTIEKVSLKTVSDVGNIIMKENIVCSLSGKHIEEIKYICDLCQQKFKHKYLLLKHIRSHTEKKPLICKFCPSQFKYKSVLACHMRKHTGEKPFACELCHYKCAQKSSVAKHMRTHTGEKPFICKLCHYKCSQNSLLVRHMRTHTGDKPFVCKLCHYKCAVSSSLVLHMKSHTGEKPFACKLCHYKCTVNSLLIKHIRIHTGEKPFACDLCQYKFSQKSSLVKHMRTHTGEKTFRKHTGEKPFACKYCQYKCYDNSDLVNHVRIHTGEKPFGCKLCQYKSCRRSDLVKHMRTHTGEKPFVCALCNFKCAIHSSLVRHKRTHAGKSTSDVRHVAHRS